MKSNKSGFGANAAVKWLSAEISKKATGPYGKPWKEPVLDRIATNKALFEAQSPEGFCQAVHALCNSLKDDEAFQKEPFRLAQLALWQIAKSAQERKDTLGYGQDV